MTLIIRWHTQQFHLFLQPLLSFISWGQCYMYPTAHWLAFFRGVWVDRVSKSGVEILQIQFRYDCTATVWLHFFFQTFFEQMVVALLGYNCNFLFLNTWSDGIKCDNCHVLWNLPHYTHVFKSQLGTKSQNWRIVTRWQKGTLNNSMTFLPYVNLPN